MGNALQELVLRIGGDSSGGQQATRDLANALTNTLTKALQDTGQKAEESSHKVSGFQRYIEELKPSTDNAHASFTSLHKTLGEMWENPTAGARNFAGAIGTDLSGALATAGGALGTTALVVGGVASVFAVAGGAAFELAEKAAATGAMLHDLSVKTGIAVGPLSVLSKAAKVAGTDISTLSNAVFMMEKNMGESPDKFEKGLERLGLHFAEFKKLAPEEQLTAIAAGLKATEDPVERNAAGFELMGRQFRDLAPILGKLNEALALTADMKPWTEEQARLGEQYEMHMASIRLHLESIVNGVGKQLLPYFERLSEILDQMSRWAPGGAMSTLLRIAGGPVGFVTGFAGPLERAYGSAALTLAAPGGVLGGLGGMMPQAGIGGLSLPTSPKSPYSQGLKVPTLENDSRVVGATNEEMFKIFDELEKEQFRKSEEAHKKYVQDWQRTEDEIQKTWAEAAVAGAAIDAKSIAGQLAILEQKRVNEENAAVQHIAETTKSEDLLEQQLAAIREKYRLLEDAAIQAATEKNISESEATGLAAAAAISKAFAGPQTVLKDLLISTGAVPISLHSILTPAQEMGHAMTDVTVSAKEHFDDLRDAITGDITDIVTRMREQGVQTREELQRTADEFKREYDAMLASGKFTVDEITEAWQRYRTAQAAVQGDIQKTQQQFAALGVTLSSVTGVLASLSRVAGAGGLFGTVADEMGRVVSAAQGIGQAMEKLESNAPGGGFNVANLAALTAGWVGIYEAMWQVADAIYAAQDAAKKLGEQFAISNQAAIDFSKTAQASMGTSAVSQGLLPLQQFSATLGKALQDSLDLLNRVYANTVITQEMIDKGFAPNSAGGVNLQRAEAMNLSAIIAELGGAASLTADQMATVRRQAGLLFDLIKDGGPIGVQALQSLDDAVSSLAETDSLGQFSDFFKEMVETARAAGVELTKVDAIMRQQAANAAQGLSDLLQQPLIANTTALGKAVDDARDALDKLKESGKASARDLANAQRDLDDALAAQHGAAVRDKRALDDIGESAVVAFNTAIASGQSFAQALKLIGPALSTIQQAYKDLGLEIDDTTLKGLALENTILNGTAEAPSGLGKAIDGLRAIITAAMNLGPAVETAGAAAAQQRTLKSLYSQAQAASANAGVTGDAGTAAALLPFQQTLHQLDDWAKKNHVELDDNTKEMIAQSHQLGIWNDDFKSDGEKTRDSLAKVVESADHLADVLGGVAAALANQVGAPPASGASSGGLVTAGGVVSYLASGGVAGWPWLPQGTDTVDQQRLVMVGMEQAAQFQRLTGLLGQSAAAQIARPGSGWPFTDTTAAPQGTSTYQVTVVGKDPVEEEQWLREWMRREGVQITVEEVEDGRYVSRLKRKLGPEIFT